MLKEPNLLYSQSSTLTEDALAKFYLSTTFDLSFMISFVALTPLSTFFPYVITKIGNRNLKVTGIRPMALCKTEVHLKIF